MIRSLFILGNHIQSLGVARMAKSIGLHVSLFSDYRTPVTRFSNACNDFFLFHGKDHLIELLTNLTLDDDRPILVPTNDNLVAFMGEHYERLGDRYKLSVPTPEILNTCLNKKLTYQAAENLGIPIPESHFPETPHDLEAIAKDLKFPVIIKPSVMHTFYGSAKRKAYLCRTQDELGKHYNMALEHIPAREIIVQEFLSGGTPTLYSYGSFSIEGKPVGSFVANRLRQKPMDFGISTTYARTVIIPEIEEQAVKFLKGIGYTGISEVEFMYDRASETYKLLEINPRTWKWHSIANKLGVNLIALLVRYHEGEYLPEFRNDLENIAWVERMTDTYVVLKEIMKGRMKLSEYLQSMNHRKESASWDLSDPLPSIMYLILSPYLYFKR